MYPLCVKTIIWRVAEDCAQHILKSYFYDIRLSLGQVRFMNFG